MRIKCNKNISLSRHQGCKYKYVSLCAAAPPLLFFFGSAQPSLGYIPLLLLPPSSFYLLPPRMREKKKKHTYRKKKEKSTTQKKKKIHSTPSCGSVRTHLFRGTLPDGRPKWSYILVYIIVFCTIYSMWLLLRLTWTWWVITWVTISSARSAIHRCVVYSAVDNSVRQEFIFSFLPLTILQNPLG